MTKAVSNVTTVAEYWTAIVDLGVVTSYRFPSANPRWSFTCGH